MNRIKKFENYNNQILLITDVQKSFRNFFTENYLNELMKYCKNFEKVYQIWDNHIDGKNIDKDYLYKEYPEIPIHEDLYSFPNQTDIIEKRYNYKVDSNFYKKILDEETFNKINDLEKSNKLKKGDFFNTKEGTIITFIGNNHKWFHCPKKLFNILKSVNKLPVTIVGGSDSECLDDIYTTAEALGVNISRNYKYIWSANHCPI
jgi:hypothetical protein